MSVRPLRVGNASGFYGDRFAAMREMLDGGELDVLTGDYLAELTMLILGRDRLKDPARGYARTFLRQLEECLGGALERGVRIVTNAGGLNPAGLAERVRALAAELGVPARVAHVEGDDLVARAGELGLGAPIAANAYLGAWGIAACLREGADIVVTGRVTDASLVVGPAAAHFGWGPQEHDALAGAVVAGHVIECGTQATGGNYPFFADLQRDGHDLTRPGFPIAEILPDGSSVITKHPGTGGAVTVGTVTAQLVYEIAGPRYPGPDVTARLDTVRLEQQGPDRVRISGVRGEAPPPGLKVVCNGMTGFANEMTVVLTGLDVEAKAALVETQLRSALAGREPAHLSFRLTGHGDPDAETQQGAGRHLRIVARDTDPRKVGRAFSATAVELALATCPGFHATSPPGDARPDGLSIHVASVPADLVPHVAVLPDGTRLDIAPASVTRPLAELPAPAPPPPPPAGPTRSVPLGLLFGARSGDKGHDANVGVWAADDAAWSWLVHRLTVREFGRLLPETARLPVTRHVLPNLRAVNFVVEGLLAPGAGVNPRPDPQAKGLAEWLRGRRVEIPEVMVP
ncbi:Protein of unknown function [Marinactinospora thermotolerans DSM 45154]|uniref:Exopolyphosphatase n=1 Tax=Marinactinospora thermotolerans DSM 45154 TaxID=1122192 RepID=A0A1T4RL55_9ACTN|nr:acyclic terpene utilization AtuA family protein [Marinactinospora thermotolerans]SKA16725.1 Protein of unknown function [Marinactinospora thermotolerans DSM 45154]